MKYRTILFSVLFSITLAGCGAFVSGDDVARAVEKQGYRNVKIVLKHIFFVDWRGCGTDDVAAFSATGTNALGEKVDLIICAGWPFKGVTVRTR